MGCAVAGLIALSPKSEAGLPDSIDPLPPLMRRLPKGQVGIASWYGEERQGRETASGEPFDMNELTAAHPSLPMGSHVLVTNLANLKSIVVKINDRGPGVADRVIDVSWAAAKKLGFTDVGLTLVQIELISFSKPPRGEASMPHSARVN